MSKKTVKASPKRGLKSESEGLDILVSVGFTPAQAQAMADVADGSAGPEAMVVVGFWAYVAQLFTDFNKLTPADLARAGFSMAQVEVLTQ